MTEKVPEIYLCRCCHSEGAYESLYASLCWLDTEEIVYSTVLQECFEFELAPVQQLLQNKLCGICDTCAYRLQDAAQFKRQVKKCEQHFRDVYASYVCEESPQNLHSTVEVTIKEEIDVEYKDAIKEVKDEADEIEEKSHRFNQLTLGEHKLNKAIKTRKCKITKTTAKVKKKREKRIATVKKDLEKTDNKEALELIDGISFIRVKSVAIRRNVDYKATDHGLQCLRCTEVAKTRDHISKHIRTVHFNTAKLKCPTCLKLFWERSALVRHKLREHNIDERIKCNACDAAFGSTQQLKNHVAGYHMLGKKIKCDECNYETYHKHYLKKHKINHSSEKSYQCQHCQKTFKTTTTLNFHERIHTGDKRKVCTECGQAFVQRASLKYHMLKHHPGVDF